MANEDFERLEGRRLVLDQPYVPTKADNQRAWAAIEPLLRKADCKGVRYEILTARAQAAAPSVTEVFIRYLVRKGCLKVRPDAK
jgi:hypothetical protein